MEYTIGNWSVKSLTDDTIKVSKTVSIPDLSYGADYAVTENSPSEARLSNKTGDSLVTPEVIRYGVNPVADVYTGLDIPTLNKFAVKTGVRTLAEVRCNIRATNSVSGEEVLLPLRGWTCLQIPTASIVTDDAVEYLLTRALAVAFDTGLTTASREIDIARSALIPKS